MVSIGWPYRLAKQADGATSLRVCSCHRGGSRPPASRGMPGITTLRIAETHERRADESESHLIDESRSARALTNATDQRL